MRSAVLLAMAVILPAGDPAGGQQLYIPPIPQHLHGGFVAALGLDDVEQRLADAAHAACAADRADADRAYSVRMQWFSANDLRALHAHDEQLAEFIASGQRHCEMVWQNTVDLIESRYFQALGEIDARDVQRIIALQRRWKRHWLMDSYYLPKDRLAGSTLDLSAALRRAEIIVPTVRGLADVVESYEAEVDDILTELRWSLAMRGLKRGTALGEAKAAVLKGDLASVERHLDSHLDGHTRLTALRQCARLREINQRYAVEILDALPWRDAVRFRAIVNPALYGYLYDASVTPPERLIAQALNEPEPIDGKVLTALGDFDSRFDRDFRTLLGDLDHSYRRAFGLDAVRAKSRRHYMRQLAEYARHNQLALEYDEGDDGSADLSEYERRLEDVRAFIRRMEREARALTGLKRP